MSFATGLEVCLGEPPPVVARGRFGLLLSQASVDRDFRYAHERLAAAHPGRLRALFGPQHGLWSTEQDNMVETGHGRDPRLGVPVYSLYSETRRPTPAMLAGLDALVVDLQDVGCRVYTYVWTLLLCLEACAGAGVAVVVLDRPNPVGGTLAEGPLLEPGFESFVGMAAIPMRHGLTLGELARLLVAERGLDVELTVVPMKGWSRRMSAPDTGRPWLPPSPNLPRFGGVMVYPGQVLLEGTNLSEGRGTTTPFECFGAPWIDPDVLRETLGEELPGVVLRPVRFEPTFHEHAGEACGGLFLHVVDPQAFRPYRTSVHLLAAVRRCWPGAFAWRAPPYEYEHRLPPIDILSGSATLRGAVEGGKGLEEACALDEAGWWARAAPHLLYG